MQFYLYSSIYTVFPDYLSFHLSVLLLLFLLCFHSLLCCSFILDHCITQFISLQPVTELECKVASMLEGSEHVIPNDKELSDAERNALMRMTVEEVGVDLHVVLCSSFYLSHQRLLILP